MVLNLLKKAALLSVELLNSERIKKRIASNMQALLSDDQVVQNVIIGFDDKQIVIVTLTNKKLYVIGDTIIHEVNKEDIYEISQAKGMLTSLVELVTVKDDIESVFFKVFTKKRAITTIENWLK